MLSKDPYLSEKDFRFIAQDIGPQLIKYIPVEVRLAGLSPQERLAGLSIEECLAGLSIQERLAGLNLEEQLDGLSLEEWLEAYLKRLKSQSSSNEKSANK